MKQTIDDLDFEVEKTPQFEYERVDLKEHAKRCIDLYFSDKNISKQILHSDKYLNLLINTDFVKGVDLVYQIIGINCNNDRKGQLPSDVSYLLAMLRDCSRRDIPRQFAIGIIIMHLELCEGYKLEAA